MLPAEPEMTEYDERTQTSSPLELRRSIPTARATPIQHNLQREPQDRTTGKCFRPINNQAFQFLVENYHFTILLHLFRLAANGSSVREWNAYSASTLR